MSLWMLIRVFGGQRALSVNSLSLVKYSRESGFQFNITCLKGMALVSFTRLLKEVNVL